eukprot:TRINITY_DN1484_c0_g1_i8.p1 TRINITY_DN1484_c0_g1~~TRINITY_DN1484_c0_g1_i8.p1  ORF type:complete len:485 (-),score=85.84 TRINITY_DN1484_c0_g1_i8:55-1509(-)
MYRSVLSLKHLVLMNTFSDHLPSNIKDITKEVLAMSAEDKESCVEDIENELTSILSIYIRTGVGKIGLPLLQRGDTQDSRNKRVLVVQENEEKSSERPIRFIPLLRLKVFFPLSYPKVTPPGYTFVSNWLPAKSLKQLRKSLDEMWSPNTPVTFEWIDYIQHSFLDTLDFAKGRRIQFSDSKDYHNVIEYLIFFDTERDQYEFTNSEVTCEICMRTMSGTNFVRLLACKHFTCKDCYKTYCESLIFDGRASQITCFSEDCKTLIPDTFLKKTLSDELYERYETFNINKALGEMEDIAWCPQCEGPAFKSEHSSLVAYCQECDFRFCLKCHNIYHPFQRCKSLEVQEEVPLEQLKDKITMSETLNTSLSNRYMNKFAKPCPKCKIPIIKTGGCNKMTCFKCKIFFCWTCREQISGYTHFEIKDGCILFTQASLVEKEQTDIDIMDVLADTTSEEYKEVIKGTGNVKTQCPQCSVCLLYTSPSPRD